MPRSSMSWRAAPPGAPCRSPRTWFRTSRSAARPRGLLDFSSENDLLDMKSDIVRYHALYLRGGLHVDVDLGPGTFDLGEDPLRIGPETIPLFGPMLRDAASLRNAMNDIERLQQKAGVSDGEKPTPAELRWRLGEFNNNFIVAAPKSSFLARLIAGMHVDDDLKRMAAAEGGATEEERRKELGEAVVNYTGPVKIRNELHAANAAKLGRGRSDPLRPSPFRTGEWMVDPQLVKRFRGIDWVTGGSEV